MVTGESTNGLADDTRQSLLISDTHTPSLTDYRQCDVILGKGKAAYT